MSREVFFMKCAFVMLCLSLFAKGSEPRGGATTSQWTDRPPDLKIAFWYDRSRPLETFRYQVYDLRKHEFSQSVIDWLELLEQRFPRYDAYIRNVRLSGGPEKAEKLEIGDAIVREFLVVGTAHGYDFSGVSVGSMARPSSSKSASRSVRVRTPVFRPDGASGPGGAPFPFPFPRPRP